MIKGNGRWVAGAAAALVIGLAGGAAVAQTAAQVHAFAASVLSNVYCTQYDYEQNAGKGASGVPVAFTQPGHISTHAYTDCSGFVDFTVSNALAGKVPAAPQSYPNCPPTTADLTSLQNSLPALPGTQLYTAVTGYWKNSGRFAYDVQNYAWPRAATWTYLFNDIQAGNAAAAGVAPYVTPVTDFRNLGAGDVLAWCYGLYCSQPGEDHKGDTGHVVIIDAAPVTSTSASTTGPSCGTLPAAPSGAAAVIGVPVIDSSIVPHFPYTVNGAPAYKAGRGISANSASGVGSGCLAFALNAQGAPLGLAFCTPGSTGCPQTEAWIPSYGIGSGDITTITGNTNFITAGHLTGVAK
ncbi:hypothetical protein [Azospirillum sp.]|uniref:hypothetical protein n=1 Tax=Azospirillum sp. TaxID=34012 RepID=UPI002D447627|nr:hypothetical protein [Azospirillum sp.]HYD64805.1 hypothetical protein [Azospirillum sp.]